MGQLEGEEARKEYDRIGCISRPQHRPWPWNPDYDRYCRPLQVTQRLEYLFIAFPIPNWLPMYFQVRTLSSLEIDVGTRCHCSFISLYHSSYSIKLNWIIFLYTKRKEDHYFERMITFKKTILDLGNSSFQSNGFGRKYEWWISCWNVIVSELSLRSFHFSFRIIFTIGY